MFCKSGPFFHEHRGYEGTSSFFDLCKSSCKYWKLLFDLCKSSCNLPGALDSEGLHIYALSLWQVGKSDLAASVRSMEPISAAACISFICRMLYYISGRESTITSIVKMPKELFRSSKVSFVVSAIHALDQSNQLEAIVSSGRSSLASHEEIIGMHFLIALSKIVKHGSEYSLGMKNGIDHLRKTLHIYPNSGLLRCLHQEPWKPNVRYLLIVNYLQKAREERFPRHLCSILKRLIGVALANELYSKKDSSVQYQQFQLLLCASEVCLQTGDFIGCVKHAKSASGLAVPNGYLFFAHLLLCRAYASKDSFVSLREEYLRCLKLNTDCHIGLISLKFIQSRYRLLDDASTLELRFEECSKEIKYSWNMWMAIYNLVRSLIAIWDQDFIRAEEFLAQACLLGDAESCIFLCHGAICMELAKRQCDSEFLLHAIRSLKKAKSTSLTPLPYVHILLGQAEASLGSKAKWETNLRLEWFSWPPELFLQMHLLSMQSKGGVGTSFNHGSLRWLLQAIHLNPSCSRYRKALERVVD